MTKFKVGDKVEVFQDGLTSTAWVGVKGIVKEVLPSYGYRVELTDVAKTGERVGYRARLGGSNLKLIEERAFKVGDRVEFIEHYMGDATLGTKATVIDTNGQYTTVRLANGQDYTPFSHRLKLVEEPKPFTFEDIQVGDTIRRTLTRKSGAKEVREGTVSKLGSWYAEDDNYILAYNSDNEKPGDVTLELLNRPEPKPKFKAVWEDAKPGTVITRGEDHLILNDKGWLVLYSDGSTQQFRKDDADVLVSHDSKVLAPTS